MQSLFDAMKTTCNELADLMLARGLKLANASIQANSRETACRVILNWAGPGRQWADQYEFVTALTVVDAVEKAEAWIAAQPTAQERARRDAIRLSELAAEAAREAGIDPGLVVVQMRGGVS